MLEIWSFLIKDESTKTPKYLMDSFSLDCFRIDFKSHMLLQWLIIRVKNYKISFGDIKW